MEEGKFKVVIIGSGCSTGVPYMRHVFDYGKFETCFVCEKAFNETNCKDCRNNVSIAIIYEWNNEKKCILVDAGKTMREACMRILPKHDIHEVNGIFITHGHADAMMGLDDVRDLQRAEQVTVEDPHNPGTMTSGFRILSGSLPIYLTEETMETVKGAFSYLTNEPRYLNEELNVLERRVAYLKFHVIKDTEEVSVAGMQVKCFPVWHGGTYVSLGFSIGKEGEFVYISDVKIIPEETWTYLKNIPKIKMLVIDALDHDGTWSHVSLQEAVDMIHILQPEQVYFTGIYCGMGLHEDIEQEVQNMNTTWHVAYDGLVLDGFTF